MTDGLPLMENVLIPLAKSILVPLGLTATGSAVDIQKKDFVSGTALLFSNEEVGAIIKIGFLSMLDC